MAETKPKVLRYYIRDSVVPFEEDMYHEFKGHRNLCVEELPPWTKETLREKASRKAVSRTMNGFVNTGKGGTVYLGIIDSGEVRGLTLTQFQKDHVVASVDDLMSRYTPSVAPHRYKVRFVPVVQRESSEEERYLQCVPYSGEECEHQERKRPHQLRTHLYCWCDKESLSQYSCGTLATDYVIEITIKPWDPADQRNAEVSCGTLVSMHPFHADEEGKVYFRTQASSRQYSMIEAAHLTRQETKEMCQQEVHRLQNEIKRLKEKIRRNDSVSELQ
uniref:Uncharacterized protein LOC111132493 n=1 Tax=Crassostrea virginica TaxID=6565 RepID=A0A8B8E8T7_CRAVI|nr:uncharacterized protein LOC111132493 [Crassostrea virginica]XP_022336012.1 uncharacterized protein LOC111132493 [Crassostrea virginica]XP_022336013.1 uncharacterized protein LOC111132493 [Crassostrea virginica]XP_022336014.1 uncharacterized protein LOC111132493 [Crassostrea virginica]